MKHPILPLKPINISNSVTPASCHKRNRLSSVCSWNRDCGGQIYIMLRVILLYSKMSHILLNASINPLHISGVSSNEKYSSQFSMIKYFPLSSLILNIRSSSSIWIAFSDKTFISPSLFQNKKTPAGVFKGCAPRKHAQRDHFISLRLYRLVSSPLFIRRCGQAAII